MKIVEQAIKYGVIGMSNTLITMVVIWIMMKTFGLPEGLSNITGYVAGLVNSYVWNRQWTFRGSETTFWRGVMRFAIAFGVCYALQYGLVLALNRHLPIDHYYNHLIGMVFYTFLNFLMNKFLTFRIRKAD